MHYCLIGNMNTPTWGAWMLMGEAWVFFFAVNWLIFGSAVLAVYCFIPFALWGIKGFSGFQHVSTIFNCQEWQKALAARDSRAHPEDEPLVLSSFPSSFTYRGTGSPLSNVDSKGIGILCHSECDNRHLSRYGAFRI